MPKRPIATTPPYDDVLIGAALREGKPEAIAQFSDMIRAELDGRNRRLREGKAQVGGTTQQANFLYRLVKACHGFNLPPPRALVVALQVLLEQDRIPAGHEKRQRQRLKAIEYLATHPGASDREIARECKVDHRTVGRWREADKLQP